MDIRTILKVSERFVVNNSPTILTTIGVVGSVTTAYLAGRASFKAGQLYQERLSDHKPTVRDVVEEVWPDYIPVVLCGAMSVAAIVGANRVGARRYAALAAAYTLSERAFTEYRDQVVEAIGPKKVAKVKDAIAQKQVTEDPPSSNVYVTDRGEVLFRDGYTGRYFKSDMEAVKGAQNRLNHTMLSDGYASLTDFYNNIGLPRTDISDEVGWTNDRMLEIDYSTAITEDNRPCIVLSFNVEPVRHYWKVG